MNSRIGRGIGGVLVAAAATTAAFYKPSSASLLQDTDKSKIKTTSTSMSDKIEKLNFAASRVNTDYNERLEQSVEKATEICHRVQHQLGLPGLSVAVAVNGKFVYQRGFGYADLENRVLMSPQSVIRIASISKPMTMAMLAKQMENGKVDITLPIQHYLPEFPQKTFEGQKVTISTKHLLSHLSGIRHYLKKEEIEAEKKRKKENKCGNDGGSDSEFKEFLQKTGCETVEKALEMFKNDELIHKPGTKYFYTTHGWTVVSAIIEKVAGITFDKHAKQMFNFWGLQNTYLDQHDPIIPNRVKYYSKDKKGNLINSPWVDNSCKWAGGGFLSTVLDLVKFAHIIIYSAQQKKDSVDKGFLKPETVQELWTGEGATKQENVHNLYGLGWVVGDPFSNCTFCNGRDAKAVSHSGGAVGANSILLIQFGPQQQQKEGGKDLKNYRCGSDDKQIEGVVVAMITNLDSAGLGATAKQIAEEFKWMM